jgi:Flp pilus assembly protein TadG
MVTAFVVIFSVALVFVVGLVFDGGRMLSAHRQARDVADAAARAGAQAISDDAIRNGERVVLDPDEAQRLACNFVAQTGYTCADVTVVDNEVVVQVQDTVGFELLPGVAATVRAQGQACVAIGIVSATC